MQMFKKNYALNFEIKRTTPPQTAGSLTRPGLNTKLKFLRKELVSKVFYI